MFSERIVHVGIDGEYPTLNEAFNHHKRGRLHIILMSEVLDEKDIFVPRTLMSLHMTTNKESPVGFSKKFMTIHCNGVRSVFEDIGREDSDLVVIGTEHNVRVASLLMKRCHADYVIGAHNVEKVNNLYLGIEEGKLNVVSGFINHDHSLSCKNMTIDVKNTKLNILHAVNITSKKEEAYASIEKGTVHVNASLIKEIRLSRGITINDDESLMELTIIGDSMVMNGVN